MLRYACTAYTQLVLHVLFVLPVLLSCGDEWEDVDDEVNAEVRLYCMYCFHCLYCLYRTANVFMYNQC
jgi:hypothetical protein